MSIILAEAAHCEHAGAYGYEGSTHTKGDQTGDEVRTIAYYNKPWNYVFRAKDPEVAKEIAIRQKQAADNPHIGYSQPGRGGYMEQLLKVHYDPSKITVDCDCDCSSLTNANVYVTLLSRGIKTAITGYETTTSMPAAYAKASAYFENVTSQINLTTGAGLQKGDIVLKSPAAHVAVVWQADSVAPSTTYSKTPQWVGRVTAPCKVFADLTTKAVLSSWASLNTGNLVDVCDTADDYYYVRIAAKYYGFVLKNCLKNTSTSAMNTTPKWVGEITAACTVYTSTAATSQLAAWPKLSATNLIDVCDESGNYYYIRIAGKYYGFVLKSFVKTQTQTGTVTTALNCRSAASSTASILGVFAANAKITIYGSTKDSNGTVWYQTTFNGKTGYCSAKYIKI